VRRRPRNVGLACRSRYRTRRRLRGRSRSGARRPGRRHRAVDAHRSAIAARGTRAVHSGDIQVGCASLRRMLGRTASFLLLVALLMASGCGNSSSSSTASSSSASAGGTTAPEGSAALAADAKSAATGDIPDSQNFLTLNDQHLRFAMIYPEGWSVQEGASGVSIKDKNNLRLNHHSRQGTGLGGRDCGSRARRSRYPAHPRPAAPLLAPCPPLANGACDASVLGRASAASPDGQGRSGPSSRSRGGSHRQYPG
jgi:hypothetical protein